VDSGNRDNKLTPTQVFVAHLNALPKLRSVEFTLGRQREKSKRTTSACTVLVIFSSLEGIGWHGGNTMIQKGTVEFKIVNADESTLYTYSQVISDNLPNPLVIDGELWTLVQLGMFEAKEENKLTVLTCKYTFFYQK
jgi:hypothetical protein